MQRALPWLAVAAAFAVALAARYGLVEPEGYGFRCESGGPWWCGPRDALIVAFHTKAIGWFAFAAGALGLVARHRPLATAACVLGAFGLVLYNYDLAAVGFALGALVLVRRDRSQTDSTGTA
jgi:hypothetical protein